MSGVRRAAVAGTFYPAGREVLARDVEAYVAEGVGRALAPKALIVPHAGYVYSGPVAGSAYRCLAPERDVVRRVVLVGPSHRVPFRGLAVSGARAFSTPLGDVPLDVDASAALEALPQVVRSDSAHAAEHSLEVHLPFLQVVLGRFALVPLLAGDVDADEAAEVLDALWGGAETRIVVSTDLSHYLDYDTACDVDLETARAIEAGDADALHGRRACGWVGVAALLRLVNRRGLHVERLDLRTSGDTAGPKDQVVGYGAWAVTE